MGTEQGETPAPKPKKFQPVVVATGIVDDLLAVSKALSSVRSDPLSKEERDELKKQVIEMDKLLTVIKEQLRPFGSPKASEAKPQ